MTKRVRAVFMEPDDIIDVKTAADRAGRDDKTIRRWVRAFGIGRSAGPHAPIEVSKVALEMVLQGDFEALELLRDGRRSAPEVRRYLDYLGLAVDPAECPSVGSRGEYAALPTAA